MTQCELFTQSQTHKNEWMPPSLSGKFSIRERWLGLCSHAWSVANASVQKLSGTKNQQKLIRGHVTRVAQWKNSANSPVMIKEWALAAKILICIYSNSIQDYFFRFSFRNFNMHVRTMSVYIWEALACIHEPNFIRNVPLWETSACTTTRSAWLKKCDRVDTIRVLKIRKRFLETLAAN